MPRHAASATAPDGGGRSSASHGASVARSGVARRAGGVPQQRRQRGEQRRIDERGGRRELVVDEPLQRALEQRPKRGRVAEQQPQPLIAPRQQRREQLLELVAIVADVAQQRAQARARARASSPATARDAAARRLAIQIVGLVDDVGRGHAVGEHGQLPREPGIERVERVDAQPLRLREQLPIVRAVARDDGAREVERRSFVRLRARLVVGGGAQRAQHAAAHLGGGLARERDGDDLLGLLHRREQREIALDQELGLARARRRLDDERLRRVERRLARRRVAHRAHQRGTAPRASASCSNTRVNGAYAPAASS